MFHLEVSGRRSPAGPGLEALEISLMPRLPEV